MTVREFKAADFPAVCRIYADAKGEELKFEPHSFQVTPLEQDEGILAAFNESDVIVFDDGKVRGFAATFSGQLRALFVHGEARGNGIGQALLNAVVDKETEGVSLNVASRTQMPSGFMHAMGSRLLEKRRGTILVSTSPTSRCNWLVLSNKRFRRYAACGLSVPEYRRSYHERQP